MQEQIFGLMSLKQLIIALVILVASVGFALFLRFFLVKIARRHAQKTKTKLDDMILSAIEKPLVALIIIGGLYLSALSLPLEGTLPSYLFKGLSIVLGVLGIYIVIALINAVIRWYRQDVRDKKKEVGIVIGLLGPFRVVVTVLAFLLAALVALRIVGNWRGRR